jgi:hypothetical protein
MRIGLMSLVKGRYCFVGRYDQIVDIVDMRHASVCVSSLTMACLVVTTCSMRPRHIEDILLNRMLMNSCYTILMYGT